MKQPLAKLKVKNKHQNMNITLYAKGDQSVFFLFLDVFLGFLEQKIYIE